MLYGISNGYTTLFGAAPLIFGHDGAIGFRVLAHFLMNAVPTALMLLALWREAKLRAATVGWDPEEVYYNRPSLLRRQAE